MDFTGFHAGCLLWVMASRPECKQRSSSRLLASSTPPAAGAHVRERSSRQCSLLSLLWAEQRVELAGVAMRDIAGD